MIRFTPSADVRETMFDRLAREDAERDSALLVAVIERRACLLDGPEAAEGRRLALRRRAEEENAAIRARNEAHRAATSLRDGRTLAEWAWDGHDALTTRITLAHRAMIAVPWHGVNNYRWAFIRCFGVKVAKLKDLRFHTLEELSLHADRMESIIAMVRARHEEILLEQRFG